MLINVHTYTLGKLYIQGYNFQPNQPTYKSGSIVKNTLATYYGVYTPTKTWAHDHMITSNYLLFFESSIQFDPEQFLAGKIFSYNNKHIFKIGVNLKTSNSSDDIGTLHYCMYIICLVCVCLSSVCVYYILITYNVYAMQIIYIYEYICYTCSYTY